MSLATLFGVPAPLHIIVHPEDAARIACDAAVLDGWIHVRSSVLVERGTAISMRPPYGRADCPRCGPDDAYLASAAATFPACTDSRWTTGDRRADAADFTAALRAALDDYPGPPCEPDRP